MKRKSNFFQSVQEWEQIYFEAVQHNERTSIASLGLILARLRWVGSGVL